MDPFITVVMPVRNEARFIKSTIDQILNQDYPKDRYEIIVADGMSDDKTQAIVNELKEKNPQIRLIENPKRRSSAGRNIGFKNGRGDYYVVVDGHCYIPNDQFLRNLASCFEQSGADCLGRPQPLDPPGLTDFQQAVALARASRIGRSGSSLIYSDYEGSASPVSNGAAYRKEVFEAIGYVDEDFDACEDVEFNYRVETAGFSCFTSPKLRVRYYPRENLKALFRQMTRYGKGRRNFTKKHPQALTLNQLIPPAFLLGVFTLCIMTLVMILFAKMNLRALDDLTQVTTYNMAANLFGYAAVLIYVLYAVYAFWVILESFAISKRNGWKLFFNLPMIFITIHSGLGWGYLKQVFFNKK